MPNVLTHGLMANQVVQKLDVNRVSKAIEAHWRPFLFGSNGPDFLFYHNYLPWMKNKDIDWIRALGGKIHKEKINEFYRQGIAYYQLQRPGHEVFLSFLAGHLCHWSLDSIAHPYVFARTGLLEGETEYHHIRFESMVDAMMVEDVLLRPLSDFPTYKFAKLTSSEQRIIALGYQYMILKTFDIQVPLKELVDCMKTMYQLLHVLFDPKAWRFHTVQWFETHGLKDPFKYTKHVVHGDLDQDHDILNLEHKPWRHPSHPEEVSTQSFLELFEQSIQRGIHVIHLLEASLETKGDTLTAFIDNRDYEMGKNDGLPARVFDLIYD